MEEQKPVCCDDCQKEKSAHNKKVLAVGGLSIALILLLNSPLIFVIFALVFMGVFWRTK